MSIFRRLLVFCFSIYAMLVFLAWMLILFPFALLSSLLGNRAGGNWMYKIVTFWADAAMICWGMRQHNIYKTPVDRQQPVVYVFNHISYLDIPVLLKAFRQQPIRILGKAEMAKIPVFGYIYRKAVILVQRDSPENRARSLQRLKRAIQQNYSVVIAPEGTFNLTGKPLKSFYDGAFRIAIETQTPIRPVLFLDNFDRLNPASVFSFTPGKCRTVFLPLVEVNGYTLDQVNELKEKVYHCMENALIEYRASWIKAPHD